MRLHPCNRAPGLQRRPSCNKSITWSCVLPPTICHSSNATLDQQQVSALISWKVVLSTYEQCYFKSHVALNLDFIGLCSTVTHSLLIGWILMWWLLCLLLYRFSTLHLRNDSYTVRQVQSLWLHYYLVNVFWVWAYSSFQQVVFTGGLNFEMLLNIYIQSMSLN